MVTSPVCRKREDEEQKQAKSLNRYRVKWYYLILMVTCPVCRKREDDEEQKQAKES